MLDARAKTVKEILHSGDQYLIPFFQRSYSWERRHWERILHDLDALSQSPPERLHFLGPLVCTPTTHVPGEVTPYQLIDGQQRITTLSLILCALRDIAIEIKHPDLAAEIEEDYLLHKRRQGLSRFKIVPRLGDREALLAILDSKDASHWQDLRVAECLQFFKKEFGKRVAATSADVIARSFRDVTARMGLVVITVMGENPYEIFESLNSTGLPLEQSDLIRNYVFMNVPLDRQQPFYDEHWRPFETLFDADGDHPAISPTGFYREYLLRAGVYRPLRDTYIDFRDLSRSRNVPPAEQVQDLKRFLNFALWIRRPQTCPDPRLKKCLSELDRLDAATANPLVMELLARVDDGSLDRDAFQQAMRDLSSFVIRRSIVGESTRGYGRWFVEAIKQIGSDPVADLRKIWTERGWPSDREFTRKLLEFPIYRREPAKCRLILDRLEQSYGHKEKVDPTTLTIEHVMPQTIESDDAGHSWRDVLGPNWFAVHQRWVHTIGNLTLTGYNSEMSNNMYGVKRSALLASNLVLNDYFDTKEQWDLLAIEERGRELATEINNIWPNPSGLTEGDSEPEKATAIVPNFDIAALRAQSLSRIREYLQLNLSQKGYARFESEDGKNRILCLASQPYIDGSDEKYWFGVTPMQLEFVSNSVEGSVSLCCGSPDRILWMPRSDFMAFVKNMDETQGKHWHIHVFSGDTLRLAQPKRDARVDVSRYLLPAG